MKNKLLLHFDEFAGSVLLIYAGKVKQPRTNLSIFLSHLHIKKRLPVPIVRTLYTLTQLGIIGRISALYFLLPTASRSL